MVTGMRLTWGDEKTKSWLEGIMANEPKFYAKNTPTVEAAGKGEIEVGFVNHYYLHRFIAENGEGFGARNYHTTADDPGSIVLVAGAGVLEQSDNKDNAEKFLNRLEQKLDIKKDKPGDKFLGGPFSIAKLESDAMSSMKIVNDKKKIS